MSHLLIWRGWVVWPLLQPATRGRSMCFGFPFGQLSCRPSLYTVVGVSFLMADHRPVPVPHSTGATVSSGPQQHHQHHTSTSSSANDVSSTSTDPTLTDTDSSLETASTTAVPAAAPAAAAATASAPLGCCRWLSSPPPSGPGLGLPPGHIRDRLPDTGPWSQPPCICLLPPPLCACLQ